MAPVCGGDLCRKIPNPAEPRWQFRGADGQNTETEWYVLFRVIINQHSSSALLFLWPATDTVSMDIK